jgi:hypothetical protein
MATWTEEERDAVKAAYLELMSGTRKVRVQFGSAGGANRVVEYQHGDIKALRTLLDEMTASLDTTTTRTRSVSLRTGKGL